MYYQQYICIDAKTQVVAAGHQLVCNGDMKHHEILGVSPSANSSEIQAAFRKSALEAHPDHSDSPEAAEAFARIKEARDALLNETTPREDIQAIRQSATSAFRSVQAAAATAQTPPTPDPAVIAKTQALDDAAYHAPKLRFFKRVKESSEILKHRKKIKRTNRRIEGKY